MDTEKILFIIIALVFSIFSMFLKSKKQKSSLHKKEEPDDLFLNESESMFFLNSDDLLNKSDVSDLQKNVNIYSKKNKKKSKEPNRKKERIQIENAEKLSQNIDLEIEESMLEGFEGSELQKAFLYSEIFKSPNI